MDYDLLTVKEAAALLKVSPYTVYRWVAEGRLPAVRYSRRVIRLRRSDVVSLREPPRLQEVATVAYETRGQGPEARVLDVEAERRELRRLAEYWRGLRDRPRDPSAPPQGSPEALKRHIGVVKEADGDELYRVIMEERAKSKRETDKPIF